MGACTPGWTGLNEPIPIVHNINYSNIEQGDDAVLCALSGKIALVLRVCALPLATVLDTVMAISCHGRNAYFLVLRSLLATKNVSG